MMLMYFGLIVSLFYLGVALFHILFVIKGIIQFYKAAFILNLSAIIIHTVLFLIRWFLEKKVPLTSVFHAFSFLALILAILYLIIDRRVKKKVLGSFAFILIFVFQLISSFGSRINTFESDILRLPVFGVHTITSIAGYGFFIYSMILGILYLYLFYELKQKRFNRLFDRLPSLETLDKTNGFCVIIGLGLLSIGIATGSVMALKIWKVFPLLDPKIFLSVVLWFICLVHIIFRYVLRWKGKSMSLFSIISFVLILIIFMVETFTLQTLHRF
ncbi:MAG: hypothetical protein E4H36_02790 [Spirochaetales bacterium]|nr:MAG: hypothetical protein E4H36_02790 [Spirochaetales bacterium]